MSRHRLVFDPLYSSKEITVTRALHAACRILLLRFLGVAAPVLAAATPIVQAQGPSPYEKAVLAKQPVSYWRLGESSGPDILDKTAKGHNGTAHGTPTFGERGAIKGDADTAIKLDGKRSYI